VRRSGKSTCLTQLISELGLAPGDYWFLNFEDPRLTDVLNYELLDGAVKAARSMAGSNRKLYFFFDEIQNVSGWEKWFHSRLALSPSDVYFITGSNASLLAGDLGSALTGRHLTIELFPFSFSELRLARPELSLIDQLKLGGFPRAATFPEPAVLLRQYWSDFVERDIRRYTSAQALTLMQLVKYVYEATGSELSLRKLASVLGISVATVTDYLQACERAYVILACNYFSYSERQRQARNRKYYPVDTGMRRAVITQGGSDFGKDFETMIFLHLKRHFMEVYYWRGEREVDFIVVEGTSLFPIQVTLQAPQERHWLGLQEWQKAYPRSAPGVVICEDNATEFLMDPRGVVLRSLG
jgi:uncharacterized protein